MVSSVVSVDTLHMLDPLLTLHQPVSMV
jgi:hypothetical protein